MGNVSSGKCLGTRIRERFRENTEPRDLWVRPPVKIPTHPGALLKLLYLEPNRITQRQLAHDLQVRLTLIRGLLQGKRRVTADLALRLVHYFDTRPRYWLDLQSAYSLAIVWAKNGAEIEQQVVPYDDIILADIVRERRGQPTVRVDIDEIIAGIKPAK